MKATVISVYMANIPKGVAEHQKMCIEKFLPEGWTFKQYLHNLSHPEAMSICIEQNKNPITVLLDIDCIPLSPNSFPYLVSSKWSCSTGALIGCVQRANHVMNGKHLYVGPFCMAFKNSVYKKMGSPKFNETNRGDVGEELTYKWQESGEPVHFIWPSKVEKPLWNLIDDVCKFGLGTTYEDLFYHSFCMRNGTTATRFINKCKEVLEEKPEEVLV